MVLGYPLQRDHLSFAIGDDEQELFQAFGVFDSATLYQQRILSLSRRKKAVAISHAPPLIALELGLSAFGGYQHRWICLLLPSYRLY